MNNCSNHKLVSAGEDIEIKVLCQKTTHECIVTFIYKDYTIIKKIKYDLYMFYSEIVDVKITTKITYKECPSEYSSEKDVETINRIISDIINNYYTP